MLTGKWTVAVNERITALQLTEPEKLSNRRTGGGRGEKWAFLRRGTRIEFGGGLGANRDRNWRDRVVVGWKKRNGRGDLGVGAVPWEPSDIHR